MNSLIPHFIHDQFKLENMHGYFEGYALFVDLSGFTRMTEALMIRGNEGAEQLSKILNDIFEPMVQLVYRHQGFVPYFAGDAFTGIFPSEKLKGKAVDILNLAQQQFSILDYATLNLDEFQIGLKMGLSFGQIEWGIVGRNPYSHYFRGHAVMSSADCHLRAKNQQIIADESFFHQLENKEEITPLEEQGFFLIPRKTIVSQDPPLSDALSAEEMDERVISLFVPDAIADYNQQGEFRTVLTVFLSFKGLHEHKDLDSFCTMVFEHANAFSGYFKEIDFGDKGGVIVVIFGAPVSYENNTERALEFIHSIREELSNLQINLDFQIKAGIASGIAFTGIVGCKQRNQYAAVGNRVNIAARLMMYAEWDEVLVDSEIQKSRHFRFQPKGDISYKGLKQPITTYQLLGRNLEYRFPYEGQIFGRKQELERLLNFGREALNISRASVAYVYGEAGIGKTRLAFELRKKLKKKRRVLWFSCPSDQILRKSFNPFTFFLRNYFEQSTGNTLAENRESFEAQFDSLVTDLLDLPQDRSDEIMREVYRIKPALAALVGLKSNNPFWENLDAKGRYENAFAAITTIFKAETLFQPFVIELEDGHSFDESSKEFLNDFCGKVVNDPIFFLITSRYDDEGNKPRLFNDDILEKHNIPVLEIDLNVLDDEALEAFSLEKLEHDIHPELLDVIQRTTNGNPFYVEQVLEYLKETDSLQLNEGAWSLKDANVDISKGFQALLTARLDRLNPEVKETVKAAAVIGSEFDLPVLAEVLKTNSDFKKQLNKTGSLRDIIRNAERLQIWRSLNDQRFIFRHTLLREAVYTMQLKSRQKLLHKLTAEAIEKVFSENLEQRFVDLVYHYEQARMETKLKFYLEKAADLAKSHYQNYQALNFYQKLLDIHTKTGIPADISLSHINLGTILELTGQWVESESMYRQALEYANKTDESSLLGLANNQLGNLLVLKGKYFEADKLLETAAAFYGSAHDNNGIARVYGNLGTLYFRQGKYDTAKLYFIRSIQLAQLYDHTSSIAQNVATLGLTYMSLGKYDEGIRWQENQLETCKKLNDKQGMAILYVNIGLVYFEKGEHDNALKYYLPGYKLSEELGNKQLIAIVTGGIGNVYMRKGRFELAREHYTKSLAYARELGDKQGIANALGLMGELNSYTGDFNSAIQYLEQNIEIGKELGDRMGVAKAVNTLGDVYYYLNEPEKSIQHYDRSINLTRAIGNKLVLGFSLVEKATVLLSIERMEDAKLHLTEALDVATELDHPELNFATDLLNARLSIASGQYNLAAEILNHMMEKARNKSEEAEVHFEFHKMSKNGEHLKKAKKLFQELYREAPKYVFKLRLDLLAKV